MNVRIGSAERRPRRFVVAPATEVPPGARRCLEAGGRAIVVFNVDGCFYGLRDACPHRGARLSGGTIVGGAVSAREPGEYEYDSARRFLKCPWHGWEFDLATGKSWVDPLRSRVRTYEVDVEPGEQIRTRGGPSAVEGPYVAETVMVTVEDEYVVVVLDREAFA
jgi:3-phenylpropionate/trans-cinnamate dioxygenase ferredoxin subunit